MFLTWLFAVAIPTMTAGYSPTGERSIRSSVLSSFAYDRMSRPATSTVAYVGFNLLAINDVVRFRSSCADPERFARGGPTQPR